MKREGKMAARLFRFREWVGNSGGLGLTSEPPRAARQPFRDSSGWLFVAGHRSVYVIVSANGLQWPMNAALH